MLQGMTSRVLAEHQRGLRYTDISRPNDLVRAPVLDHPVLVDARLVREGVAPTIALFAWTGSPVNSVSS